MLLFKNCFFVIYIQGTTFKIHHEEKVSFPACYPTIHSSSSEATTSLFWYILPELFHAYIPTHSLPPLNSKTALSKVHCSASYFFCLLLYLGNNFITVHRELPHSYLWLQGILLSAWVYLTISLSLNIMFILVSCYQKQSHDFSCISTFPLVWVQM